MVTKFSVATEHSYKDAGGDWAKSTTWHNVVLWGNEKLAGLLVKGAMVAVDGRTENRSYETSSGEKKYVTEIVADTVVLCGGSSGEGRSSGGGSYNSGDDMDVPF